MRRERILAGMESGEEIENDWLVSPWKYKKKKKTAGKWTKVGGRRSDILRYGGKDCDPKYTTQWDYYY